MSPRFFALVALSLTGCASERPVSPSARESLLLQALIYGVDSLARGDGRHLPICVGIDTGRETADPSSAILTELRKRDSRVMARSRCQPMFRDIGAVHDTVFIAANLDSIATTPPRIGLRTWRSGLWGGGYLCSLRSDGGNWQLGECQMIWIS
jgi:hypothetical protein